MTTRIAFLGDTLLGGQAQETLDRRGDDVAFEALAPVLADADLVVANLEGPVTARAGRSEKPEIEGKRRHWYRAPPRSLGALTRAGVRVVSLANNHMLDFGAEGLADTLGALDAGGIAHCGAGPDEARARTPVLIQVGGRRVGFVSLMQRYDMYVAEGRYASGARGGVALLDPARLEEGMASLAGADVRVALVHWGRTYQPVTPAQGELAALLGEAGADLVVGHHPHIAQPVALGGACPVLFSLGNGPFGAKGRFAKKGRPPYGLVATLELGDDGRPAALELRLIHVDNRALEYRPEPARGPEAMRFLRSLAGPGSEWRDAGECRMRVELGGG